DSGVGGSRFYADALYGSGLHADAILPNGASVPNGRTLPAYFSLNLGVEQTFEAHAQQAWKARLDLVNVTDNVYQLRDGSGIGVNAAQFGMRFGVFGSVSFVF